MGTNACVIQEIPSPHLRSSLGLPNQEPDAEVIKSLKIKSKSKTERYSLLLIPHLRSDLRRHEPTTISGSGSSLSIGDGELGNGYAG